ncbi:MAG: hypothetical protein ACKOYM_02535 [Actinomycetes bacterium]
MQANPPAAPPAGSTEPPNGPESALPSVGARIAAFIAILIGGAASGTIGAAFARLGGFDGAAAGAILLCSALVGAGGVAVVAVLTLRAFGEWETIRRRDAASNTSRHRVG